MNKTNKMRMTGWMAMALAFWTVQAAMAGTPSATTGDVAFQRRDTQSPANDNFVAAATISGTTGSVEGTTVDSTMESFDLIPEWYGYSYSSTVWYRWTAPKGGIYAFSVADADAEMGRGAAVGVTTGFDGETEAWSGADVNWQRIVVHAVQGAEYWIEVGSYAGDEFDFTLSWRELHSPANDAFADAATLSGAAGSVEGTTVDSTEEPGDLIPERYSYSYGSTVWYQWTAPKGGVYAFSVADAEGKGAAVGMTTGYDEEERVWTDADVDWKRTTVHATQGVPYWIAVGSYAGDEIDFTLSWKEIHPPANDDFADAAAISGTTGSVGGTTVDSTRETPDLIPDQYDYSCGSTVWYQWTAPQGGFYAFSVANGDEERWRGVAVGLTAGYDEETGEWSDVHVNWRRVMAPVTEGATYWIAVGGYPEEESDFTLSWQEASPPSNDDFANAATITGATGSVDGSTVDSTRESPDLVADRDGAPSTVWYQWTAPGDGAYVFSVVDADVDRWRGAAVGVTTGYDGEEEAWSDADVDWRRIVVQATKGVRYWIEVGSYSGDELDFTLSWHEAQPPANDDFADAAAISGATGSVGGTTIDSTRETADLIADQYSSSYSSTVWYQWTAPEGGLYAFSVADADVERGEGAVVGVTTGYDREEGVWSDADVEWRRIVFQATKGVPYWIEVGSSSGDAFDFTLSWRGINPPTNDDFANATAISGATGSVAGTTIDSTGETADLIPDQYESAYKSTVWYQWTAPEDGSYVFTVVDADEERGRDVLVGVTTGYEVEAGAWSAAAVNWRRIVVQATKDATYWIEVGSYSSEEIDFTLSWKSFVKPANDNFAAAIALEGVSGSTTGYNLGAGVEEGEPLPLEKEEDWTFGTTASVWWKWKAPEDGSFTVSTAGSDFDTVLGVYTGTSVDGLATVAANDERDGGDSTSLVVFGATKGTVYYFAVGGYESRVGDIVLSWNRGGEAGDVVVDAGGGKTVTVPGAWLAANTTRGATDVAANGRRVWECYVLGLDPEGEADFRITSFPMKADGTPDLAHIEVRPDPAAWNVPATLQLKGAETLAGPWNDVPGDGDAACRFFAAEFVLP